MSRVKIFQFLAFFLVKFEMVAKAFGWRNRPPAAPQPIIFTSSCRAHHIPSTPSPTPKSMKVLIRPRVKTKQQNSLKWKNTKRVSSVLITTKYLIPLTQLYP